jgi:hypothetical protein
VEEDGSRRLIQRWVSPRNSRTLDNLSLLKNGGFIWQVEGIRGGIDGPIRQRGTVGENRFTIDLPPIPLNTAKDPGIVYGQ